MAGKEVVADCADDDDGGCGDQDKDFGAGVGASDAEVMQSAAVAQNEFAELVDGVVADAEVLGALAAGVGFWSGVVGLGRGGVYGQGAVDALVVGDVAELVKLCL